MATNKNIDIDKLFRDKLSDYELESPDNVWNNIMLQKANKPVWKYSYSIVILLVSALSGLSFWYSNAEQNQLQNNNMVALGNTEQIDQISNSEKLQNNENIKSINYQNKEQNTKIEKNNFSENIVDKIIAKSTTANQTKHDYFASKSNLKNIENSIPNNNQNNSLNENITTKNTTTETPQKTNNDDAFSAFNKTISRDKSIPSLVINLDKKKSDKIDGTDGENKTNNNQVVYKPSPWSFEVGLRTSFANSSFTNSSPDWSKQVEARKQSESFSPSFGFNVKANYSVNKKISLVSGISYLNLKQKLDFKHTNTTITIEQKTKQGYTLNPDGSVSPYTYSYMDTTQNTINNNRQNTNHISMVDIPLMLDVKLFAKKGVFCLSLQPGVIANVYMKKSGYEINKNADNTEMTNANNYKLSAGINYRLGLSAEWILSPKTSIVVQPYYLQNAKGLNGKNYPVNYKINQISTDIGIRFQLP